MRSEGENSQLQPCSAVLYVVHPHQVQHASGDGCAPPKVELRMCSGYGGNNANKQCDTAQHRMCVLQQSSALCLRFIITVLLHDQVNNIPCCNATKLDCLKSMDVMNGSHDFDMKMLQ
jgi:hypothetical protein